MMNKTFAISAMIGGLTLAGAALAQPAAYDKDGIPASSPISPLTVNPMPDRDADNYPAPRNTTQTSGAQARVPVSADVAAALGIPVQIISNGPVPDTPENRARYGQPRSNAGRMTKPAGNCPPSFPGVARRAFLPTRA